jgi:aryl-alcohol dehydrogenase-like predicted oxidoreductase
MFEKILGVVDHLRSIGEGYERTLAHLALNWILSRPGITTALVGMLQPWQLEENIRATGWTLTPEDLKKIDQLIDSADLGLRILPPDEYLEKTKEKPA